MESFSETLNVPFILELILVCIIQSLKNYKLCSSIQVSWRIKFYPAIPNRQSLPDPELSVHVVFETFGV